MVSHNETTERMPWCPSCEAFSVPLDDGSCGECGTEIELREGPV